MKFDRSGIIINVENYEACVSFYATVFGLPILLEQNKGDFKLTCFEFGGSYLMIETEGFAKPSGKTIRESPAKLRFNVPDIEVALASIRKYGIDAKIENYAWGSTINIFDPDGNRIGIRDEAMFRTQLEDRNYRTLYHVASLSDLANLETSDNYKCASLASEGFIHCCYEHQLSGVLDRYYQGVEDILLLRLDPDKLFSKLVNENTTGGQELFPHIYGPINIEAIIERLDLNDCSIEK